MAFFSDFRSYFVKKVYADHNDSKQVKHALKKSLDMMPENGVGLNIGAGYTIIDGRFKNLDIFDGPEIDIVAKAECIPLPDNSIDMVITQEVLEHVENPIKAIAEISRVLKPNGILFCQLPFIIGYHPGPTDFWRFTKEGIVTLVENNGLKCKKLGMTVGPMTGFYRILVELLAIIISMPFAKLYIPAKFLMALLFYPIKYLDIFLINSPQADRISGGYFVVAQKKAASH